MTERSGRRGRPNEHGRSSRRPNANRGAGRKAGANATARHPSSGKIYRIADFDETYTMSTHVFVRLGLCIALAVGFSPLLLCHADSAPETIKTAYYKGKVVPLAGIMEKMGVKLDADAAPSWLALVGDDGKIYPLVKDDGCAHVLQGRPAPQSADALTGRLLPGSQLLQVVEVHSYNQKHELQEVYYWCDICSIKPL